MLMLEGMDNFTLLICINIILVISCIFTFIIPFEITRKVFRNWRLSAVFMLAGVFLLTTQISFAPILSILLSNLFIILGFYFQIDTAHRFESHSSYFPKVLLPLLIIVYLALFTWFTYIRFNTPIRIIIISGLMVVLFGWGSIGLSFSYRKNGKREAPEVFYLFVFSTFFYFFRIVITLLEGGPLVSLYHASISTTISFLYMLIYSLLFLLSMFIASIRRDKYQINEEKNRFRFLFDFLNDTARHLNLKELHLSIETILKKTLLVDTAGIFLLDKTGKYLIMTHNFNALELPLNGVRRLKVGEGLAGKAVQQEKTLCMAIEDYPNKPVAKVFHKKGVVLMRSIPLRSSGKILGAITVAFRRQEYDKKLDTRFYTYLGEQIGLVIHNALLYEEVSLWAHTDPLTGLYNRRRMEELFLHEQHRSKRNRTTFAIAMIDLDHFKRINDTYGHETGDEVLKSTAEFFRGQCRDTDYIGRWGGEEFLILLNDTDIEAAEFVSERMRGLFAIREFPFMGKEKMTFSMGITAFDAALSRDHLINRADQALYKAKNKGRNRIEVY